MNEKIESTLEVLWDMEDLVTYLKNLDDETEDFSELKEKIKYLKIELTKLEQVL